MQSPTDIPTQAAVEFPGLTFAPVPLPISLPPPPPIPAAPTRTSKSSAGKIAVAGRWTIEEHKLFLEGLGIHGKAWKKIATSIRTRSVTQVRTHAQKYFLKQSKGKKYMNDESQNHGDMPPCSPHDLAFPLQSSLQKRKLDDISTGIQSSATSKDWNSDFALFLDSSKLHPSEFSILGTCFETNPNLSSIANDGRNMCMIPPTSNLPKITVDINAANISTLSLSGLPTKKSCVEKKGTQLQYSPKSICNSLSFDDLCHHPISLDQCANSSSLYRDAFQNEDSMLAHMLPQSTSIASVTMEDILLIKDEDMYDDMIPNFLDHVTIDNFDSFFENDNLSCAIGAAYDHSDGQKNEVVNNYRIPQEMGLQKLPSHCQFSQVDSMSYCNKMDNNSHLIINTTFDKKCFPSSKAVNTNNTSTSLFYSQEEETNEDSDNISGDDSLSDCFSEDIFDNGFDCIFDYLSE